MSGPAQWYTQLPTKEEVVDVLRAAKVLIQERGWVQGTMTDKDGRVCLDAAIVIAAEIAADNISDRVHRQMDAEFVMQRYLGLDPVRWNDQAGRTSKQVLHALEEAAQRLEASSESGREAIYTLGERQAGVRR